MSSMVRSLSGERDTEWSDVSDAKPPRAAVGDGMCSESCCCCRRDVQSRRRGRDHEFNASEKAQDGGQTIPLGRRRRSGLGKSIRQIGKRGKAADSERQEASSGGQYSTPALQRCDTDVGVAGLAT